jgi:hypothetical protein
MPGGSSRSQRAAGPLGRWPLGGLPPRLAQQCVPQRASGKASACGRVRAATRRIHDAPTRHPTGRRLSLVVGSWVVLAGLPLELESE